MVEPPSSAELAQSLGQECSRLEEDTLYSARGHFEAARTWGRVHLTIGLPTALLAAVAGVSAFNNLPLLAGGTSILVAALSSVSTFLNPSEKAQTHLLAGNKFNAVRSQARLLREVTLRTSASKDDVAITLHGLVSTKDTLNQESPIIPRPAFERARKGIAAGEAAYAVDRRG
jgi:hypothetical protein